MKRYFLGSNTAEGFQGFYDEELKCKKKVFLLKGGPGTGKSTLMKTVAKECIKRGLEHEEWYCSGDPESIDGIYIVDTNVAVVDATAPHAQEAALPKLRDHLINLAECLNCDDLSVNSAIIKKLLNDKKQHFTRAYQHLKCAYCHNAAKNELYKNNLNERDLRLFSLNYFESLQKEICRNERENLKHLYNQNSKRNLFYRVISPSGDNEYFDHLRDKEIVEVRGNSLSTAMFFDTLFDYLDEGIFLRNPLCPSVIEGVVLKDKAIVCRTGHYSESISECIELGIYEKKTNAIWIEEENIAKSIEMALAEKELNEARKCHLGVEKYFVGAMDFVKLQNIREKLLADCFETRS